MTRYLFVLGLVCGQLLLCSPALQAEERDPTRYALTAGGGFSFSTHDDVDFVQLSLSALLDQDPLFQLQLPESLRFKLEGTVALTTEPDHRIMAGADMLALYFLDGLSSQWLRPYVEAGIGLAYTDFKVEGQGLRVNFRSQAGIGSEIQLGDGPPWFAAVRVQHLSNAGLDEDNAGINLICFQLGRFF
ncbi:MAG: acyloxyacyl hydrolase [Desulfuromonadaceae bacterium]